MWMTVLGLAMMQVDAMKALEPSRPIVIAHRGASGLRPEHTLASYGLAIEQGADFIEPDVVMTKDGVLVARHENEISGTTDVERHPEFADRRTTKLIDGRQVTGWFTEDFTLAELKTLRARERLPQLRPANMAWDGQEEVPTLQEIIDLVKSREGTRGKRIGLYIETKHPTYFREAGLPLEEALARLLAKNGYGKAEDPVFIQSFEVANLKRLKALTGVRLVQLLDGSGGPADGTKLSYAAMATTAGLKEIATYAAGVGPAKALILPRDAEGRSAQPTSFIVDAHAAGLVVHPWTFRSENYFLPLENRRGALQKRGDAAAEYRRFIELGVDGVFSDFPADAIAATETLTAP